MKGVRLFFWACSGDNNMAEQKKRAIVLDDELAILEYFKGMLDVLGYEVEIYCTPVLCPLYNGGV